jgi:hypothetical protein
MSVPASLLLNYLLYFLFPLWLVAGFADYLCHRRTAIERTSGWRETLFHVAQAVQLGVALFVGLFLEINALALFIMIGAVLAHAFTSFWDVRYTAPRRYISPLEQHVHSHLEWIPIAAVSIVVLLYWDQLSGPAPSFSLSLKDNPLPRSYLAVTLGLIAAVLVLPLAEECVRAVPKARRR